MPGLLPPHERRTVKVLLCLTAKERAALGDAAESAGQPLARWIRETVMAAVELAAFCSDSCEADSTKRER